MDIEINVDVPLKLDTIFKILEKTQPSSKEAGIWCVFHNEIPLFGDSYVDESRVSFQIRKCSFNGFISEHLHGRENDEYSINIDFDEDGRHFYINLMKGEDEIDHNGDGGIVTINCTQFLYINHCHDNVQTFYHLDTLKRFISQ